MQVHEGLLPVLDLVDGGEADGVTVKLPQDKKAATLFDRLREVEFVQLEPLGAARKAGGSTPSVFRCSAVAVWK